MKDNDILLLSVLQPGYFLSVGPLYRFGDQPYDIYLVRGLQVMYKVETPGHFIGRVSIESDSDSLKFLRFFSLPDTNYLFLQDKNDVFSEVFRAAPEHDPDGDICLNVIDSGTWDERGLRCPSVRPASSSDLEPVNDLCPGACERGFVVERTVVCPDQQLYRVTQVVCADGRFATISKTPLKIDASSVGVHFLGRL